MQCLRTGQGSARDAIDDLHRAAEAGDSIALEILPVVKAGATCETGPEIDIFCEKPFLAFASNFLGPLSCAYLIAAAKARLRPSDVIDSKTGKQKLSEVRVSETAWWRAEQMDLVMHDIFQRVVCAFGGEIHLAEAMNVVRYGQGGIFRSHLDAYPNYATGHVDGQVRATTSIVYLNDGYEGGETAFIRPKLKISGKAGDMLHFKNITAEGEIDAASAHAGMPVTSGEKWVLVQWVRKG